MKKLSRSEMTAVQGGKYGCVCRSYKQEEIYHSYVGKNTNTYFYHWDQYMYQIKVDCHLYGR